MSGQRRRFRRTFLVVKTRKRSVKAGFRREGALFG